MIPPRYLDMKHLRNLVERSIRTCKYQEVVGSNRGDMSQALSNYLWNRCHVELLHFTTQKGCPTRC